MRGVPRKKRASKKKKKKRDNLITRKARSTTRHVGAEGVGGKKAFKLGGDRPNAGGGPKKLPQRTIAERDARRNKFCTRKRPSPPGRKKTNQLKQGAGTYLGLGR